MEKSLKGICVNNLVGNPSEMRSAVVNEFHGVNPVQLGRERIVFNFGMNKRLECSGY